MSGALLASVSGLLHFALLPPFSWSWLAWIALIPFLWCLSRSDVTTGSALGAAFGLQLSAAVYWWFPGMLARFFHFPVLAAWAAGALAGFLVAAPYAALGSWVSYLFRHGRATPFSIAAGWVLAEFVSARWLIPNRLGLLAHSQIGSDISQVVALVGQYGLSFLIVAVNVVFLILLRDRSWSALVRPTTIIVSAGLALGFLYGGHQRNKEYGNGRVATVAVVQGGIELEFDQHPDQRSENFEHYTALTSKVTSTNGPLNLVFWPEWAAGVYLGDSSNEAEENLAALAHIEPELVVGAPHRHQVDDEKLFFNSVFLLRRGSIEGRYDKQRLIPLAETDPLARIGGVLDRPSYSPGLGPSILPSLSGRVGVMICSESTNPGVARELVGVGAEILANPSNDYWMGRREPALLQLRVAALRAIENRRYLVRPTSTGLSAVIDPTGDVLMESRSSGSEVLVSEIELISQVTVYQRIGDLIVWMSAAIVAWQLTVVRLRKHQPWSLLPMT